MTKDEHLAVIASLGFTQAEVDTIAGFSEWDEKTEQLRLLPREPGERELRNRLFRAMVPPGTRLSDLARDGQEIRL